MSNDSGGCLVTLLIVCAFIAGVFVGFGGNDADRCATMLALSDTWADSVMVVKKYDDCMWGADALVPERPEPTRPDSLPPAPSPAAEPDHD